MKKKRIGLMLASIHSGSGGQVCSSLIREATFFDTTFYIFPGGRLKAPQNSEFLRNPVYKLANSKNIDGLISWASSLGGEVSLSELTDFHKNLEPLPFVTISQKIEGHSCVNFNAYEGMAELVKHFLLVHHSKNIAFIRGPENHVSANDRFKAFCDTMQLSGIPVENSPLISDPFEWRNGKDAVRQLVEERGLVPGKDFDTLIASSDIMAFDAIDYLQKKGFTVPDDYLAAGFNDVSRSRMMLSALTTVHMPYKNMGLDSYELILNELDNPNRIKRNIVLTSPLVVRESCGCSVSSTFNSLKTESTEVLTSRQIMKEQELLISSLTKLFRLDKTNQNAIIEPILNAIWSKSTQLVFNLISKSFRRFCENDLDTRIVYRALNIIRESPSVDASYIQSIEKNILLILGQVLEQYQEEQKTNREERNKVLDELKCQLISTHSVKELVKALQDYLPRIGINAAATVLYENENSSLFCGGFSKSKTFEEESFELDEIIPSHLSSSFSNNIFLIQPLFADNKTIGHFICSVPFFDGVLFEDLRSIISSMFSGIFLFNEMTQARKTAENAERAKTKFFSSVGNDLSKPLYEISDNAFELEQLLKDQNLLSDSVKLIVNKLKENINKQLERTNLIVDLTRTQSNEIIFNNHLFRPESLFEDQAAIKNIKPLPLLFGDKKRLVQALNLLAKNFHFKLKDCSAQKLPRGLLISLPNKETNSDLSIWKESEVLLANQILLMQNCEVIKKESNSDILFRWPDFACSTETKNLKEDSNFSLSEWNFAGKTDAEIRVQYNLRNKEDFIHNTFLCYTEDDSTTIEQNSNFISLFEYKLGISGQPILLINCPIGLEKKWNLPVPIMRIESASEIEHRLINSRPAIIVIKGIDIQTISKIRNNPKTELSPIVVLSEKIEQNQDIEKLRTIQKIILCNDCVAFSPEFGERLRSLLSGETMLSPDTGSIVKKAIIYFNRYGKDYISRWKLSEAVHTSEDYLTRIFHKETGLSPWEYLSLYRVNLACIQLRQTNDSISVIAEKSGFQDQAYFCRVFKKITGTTPGRFRKGLEID